jgi:hypothetical protein
LNQPFKRKSRDYRIEPRKAPTARNGNSLKINALMLSGILLLLAGCRHSPDVPLTPLLTFDQDVSAITLNNCATVGCHDGSSRRRQLVTYTEVMQYVTPGKPYQSKLFTAITRLGGKKMPPQGPLSDDQIKAIYIWILQGAKEN